MRLTVVGRLIILSLAAVVLAACARETSVREPTPDGVMLTAALLAGSGQLNDRVTGVGELRPEGKATDEYARLAEVMLERDLTRMTAPYGTTIVGVEAMLRLADEHDLGLGPDVSPDDLVVMRDLAGIEVLVTGVVFVRGAKEKITAYAMDTTTGRILVRLEAPGPSRLAVGNQGCGLTQ